MSNVRNVLVYLEAPRAPSSTAATRGGDDSSNNSYISDDDNENDVVDIEISASNTANIANSNSSEPHASIDVAACYNDDYYNNFASASAANSVATTAKSDIATICSGSIANENVFSSNMEDDDEVGDDIIVPNNDNVATETILNNMGPPKNSSACTGSNYNESIASDVADVDNDDIHSLASTSTNITATNADENNALHSIPTSNIINENNTEKLSPERENTNTNNGRMSPGGTVYKGRGVRRYQGRYMNLPLKRFHHNNNFLHLSNTDSYSNTTLSNHDYEQHNYNNDTRSRSRSRSPDHHRHHYHPYRDNHYHNSRGRGSMREEYHNHSKNSSYYSSHRYYQQQHHNRYSHHYRQSTANHRNKSISSFLEKNHKR